MLHSSGQNHACSKSRLVLSFLCALLSVRSCIKAEISFKIERVNESVWLKFTAILGGSSDVTVDDNF